LFFTEKKQSTFSNFFCPKPFAKTIRKKFEKFQNLVFKKKGQKIFHKLVKIGHQIIPYGI
jgi:hypothetical protein